MPPEPKITDTPQSVIPVHHFKVRVPLVIGLLLAFAVLVGVLTLLPRAGNYITQEVSELTPLSMNEALKGKVYLSLAPVTEAGVGKVGVYAFDVETSELEPVATNKSENFLASRFSPDGTKVAVSKGSDDKIEIYVGDALMSDLESVTLDPSYVVARNATWSKDGSMFTFMARTEAGSGVDDWTVFVYNLEAKEARPLASGSSPVFLPDNRVLYIKNDGLYIATLNGESSVAVTLPYAAASNMRLDITNDGKYLAWTDPSAERLDVYEITSLTPFAMATTTSLADGAFWPVFSPKGDYLAYESFDWSGGVTRGDRKVENYRLLFYSLREKKWMEQSLGLTPYYQDALFITDWR